MIYLITYTYEEQRANKSFHFVEAISPEEATDKAARYVAVLLYHRFGKWTKFTFEDIDLIPNDINQTELADFINNIN